MSSIHIHYNNQALVEGLRNSFDPVPRIANLNPSEVVTNGVGGVKHQSNLMTAHTAGCSRFASILLSRLQLHSIVSDGQVEGKHVGSPIRRSPLHVDGGALGCAFDNSAHEAELMPCQALSQADRHSIGRTMSTTASAFVHRLVGQRLAKEGRLVVHTTITTAASATLLTVAMELATSRRQHLGVACTYAKPLDRAASRAAVVAHLARRHA